MLASLRPHLREVRERETPFLIKMVENDGLISYRSKYCGIPSSCSLRDLPALNKHMPNPNPNKTNKRTRGKKKI